MNNFSKVSRKIRQLGPDECWPWTGYKSGGYGRIDIGGLKGVYAHRIAYLMANPGAITLDMKDGIYVLHTCDNRRCCNPAHLYLGDHDQNMRDKAERGGMKWTSIGSPRAKLTTEEVLDIRAKKKSGATCKALALLYEVSASTIHGVLYGRHYQDI